MLKPAVSFLRLNSIRSNLLILLGLLILVSALLTVPLVISAHARNQPRLTLHELVRLIEGKRLVMEIPALERVVTPTAPPPNGTEAEWIIADKLASALSVDRARVRVTLDEDDRGNGPEYGKRLAVYGNGQASNLAIDGTFIIGLQRADDRWLTVSHESAPRIGYLRILTLRLTLIGILVLICLWFASRIVRPLQKLAWAASQFARRIEIDPVPLEGPEEVRTAAAAFNRMHEQISAHLVERTTMLLAIAHDLRTPLARIRFRNALGGSDASVSINREIVHMERLIGTMLQYAEGQGQHPEMDMLDLPSLVDGVVQNFSDTGCDVASEETAPITIMGDQVLLKRMIENLIDNAIKYGGSAQVAVRKDGATACIEVADDGPGMTPDQIARAFEPFYRADASRDCELGGAGLGLSIVEMVAKGHDGRVDIQNRDAGGLAIRVILPLNVIV